MHHPAIRRVHVVFKTHLDVGFTAPAREVVARYMEEFVPAALERARHGRFVWTTGSWLIHHGLEQADAARRRDLERAIKAGHVAWHALPFTTHTELMPPDLFRYALSIAGELDGRFGKRTLAAKMTDVPGHTRAILPHLAAAGVELLHIGVNPASRPPAVPGAFRWVHPDGSEVVVLYSKCGYGADHVLPGLEEALVIAHTNDNLGPQDHKTLARCMDEIEGRYPEAEVIPSTLDAFAEALRPIRAALPVVTEEIGDTWIHGVGSDPRKVARYRALCRLRARWLRTGELRPAQGATKAFSERLLMIPEHTWGLDEKTHLADTDSYDARAFRQARRREPFRRMEDSWAEQRAYLDEAVAALPRKALRDAAHAAEAALIARRPSHCGYQAVDPGASFVTARWALGFDAETGALNKLMTTETDRRWADRAHPLGLLRYQTFDQADYDRFLDQYNLELDDPAVAAWAIPDFSKPGIDRSGARSAWYTPQLVRLSRKDEEETTFFLAELTFPDEAVTLFGCPALITMEWRLPADRPSAELRLQWFEKQACRLPEALWLTLQPIGSSRGAWALEKMGDWIDPGEVLRHGARQLHAVGRGARLRMPEGGALWFDTLDAPLVAPGAPALLTHRNRKPHMGGGIHVNLHNNVWGTNFPMWYGEDGAARFALHAVEGDREPAPPPMDD